MRWTNVLPATLLLACLAACSRSGPVSTTTSRPSAKEPTTSVTSRVPGASASVAVAASGRRQQTPGDVPAGADLPTGAVPADPAADWTPDRWGPTNSDAGSGTVPPPAHDRSYVVVWDQRPTTGWALAFSSARLDGGALVISGERTGPGADCAVAQVLTGTSYLLSVAVPDLSPGAPVRFELSETMKNCDG